MTKPKKRTAEEAMKATEEQRWREEALAIEAMTSDEVDAELRAAGGDPAKIRAEGEALAKRLHAERVSAHDAPLPWVAKANARLEEVRAMVAVGTVRKTKLSRGELLAKVDEARNDPRFAKPVAALFRKRSAEESSDAELEALLEAMELLGAIEDQETP